MNTLISTVKVWITAALASLAGATASHADVLPGIDVLASRGFDLLAGKNVGLITNHTGVSKAGVSDIDILFAAKSHKLVALFSPEHGIRGDEDVPVTNGKDEKTGLPVYSLYGDTMKPTPQMLKGIDVLVFDIQDIGTRFYTYIATMAYAMQAAKENHIRIVVLDRPNPVGGEKVEGAVPSTDFCSGLTCIYPIPTRHGMTVGELAQMFNTYYKIGSDLAVVPMTGWTRDLYFDETGLKWINPSPNMKTVEGAILYPGLGVAETTDLSVGRGTDRPFEIYGAPYFNGDKLALNLSKRNIPGIRFESVSFVPTAPYHPYKDQLCKGVRAFITDRHQLNSAIAGLHLIQAIYETHPGRYTAQDGFKVEVGDKEAWNLLTRQKKTPEQVAQRWDAKLKEFLDNRSRFLLY